MDNNYNVIMKWFENLLDKKLWSDYLTEYGYRKIAVYGAGELGRYFIRELENTKVIVECVIDKNADRIDSVFGKPTYTLNQFYDQEIECDAIVVTVISADREVLLEALDKNPVIPVLSLRDMIYEL